MIQSILCYWLLRIIITRETDRDREKGWKPFLQRAFSRFCSTDHQRSLAPLCLVCCQLVCKHGSKPTPLEPGRATHNQEALQTARHLVDVCLSGTVLTHFLIHSSGEFSSFVVEQHHRFNKGGGKWRAVIVREIQPCIWAPPLCSPSIFVGIKTKSMSPGRELIPVALCFVWAPPPFIIHHQSAMKRMKGPQSD